MWRADGDVLKKALTEKINEKPFIWKNKKKMERHHRKGYVISTLDWILIREKWGGLLVIAQVINGPLSWE